MYASFHTDHHILPSDVMSVGCSLNMRQISTAEFRMHYDIYHSQ